MANRDRDGLGFKKSQKIPLLSTLTTDTTHAHYIIIYTQHSIAFSNAVLSGLLEALSIRLAASIRALKVSFSS